MLKRQIKTKSRVNYIMKVCRVTEKVEWFAVQPFDVYACMYIYIYTYNKFNVYYT